jgi:hypothetical protein
MNTGRLNTESELCLELLTIGSIAVDRALSLEDSPNYMLAEVLEESTVEVELQGEYGPMLGHEITYAHAALFFLAVQEHAEDPDFPNLTAFWHEWQRRGRQAMKHLRPELRDRLPDFRTLEEVGDE